MKISERLNDDVFTTDVCPSYLYNDQWRFENKQVIHRKTGKAMTNFQAYLLEGIHETHKSRNGSMRSSSWDVYEEHFMAVAMTSDYSGTSFTKRALVAMLKDELYKNFPDKFPDEEDDRHNDWTIFYWQYNGEQIVLRVVDDNLEPTTVARWFFIDTNYYNFLENVEELQDRAGDYFMKRFFSEAYLETGRGINYQTMNSDGQVIQSLPDYKGDPFAVMPPLWKAPDKSFQEYYDQIILDAFKENVDSLTWSYKSYLVPHWDSEENIKKLYEYAVKHNYFETSDYTEEIVFFAEGFPMIWALKQCDLLDTSSMHQFFDEDYDSDEFLGDECLHLFKILDDISPSDRNSFIDFMIKDINTIQSELSGLTYRVRMWTILKAMHENWIGD